MNKKNSDNELVTKVIDLCLLNSIEESKLYLKFLDNQINFYQSHIDFLENTRPYFFQKKKLEEHNKEIEKYENKIRDIYIKIEQEIDEIEKCNMAIYSNN